MEKHDVIFFGAAILLSGRVKGGAVPPDAEIQAAVESARKVHAEVEKQCTPSQVTGVTDLGKSLEREGRG